MNGKLLKHIRQAASELPPSIIEGEEIRHLHKSEVPEEDKEAVDALKTEFVKYKRSIVEELDHVKHMKKFYKRHGRSNFMKKYVQWFQIHHIKMIEKYPEMVKPLKSDTDAA